MPTALAAALLVLAVAVPAVALAQMTSFGPEGDWGGARTRLLERGIRLDALYIGEAAGTLDGGVRRDATYLDAIGLKLTLDGERLVGLRGFTLYAQGLGTSGGDPSTFVGDAQGVSEIAAPRDWKLFEGWVQQTFADGRLSILAGRYDLNTEFYALASASLFVNSSFGIGAEVAMTGIGGPSIFPDTSLGGRIEVQPAPGFTLRTAVLDAVPVGVERSNGSTPPFSGDGLLLVGEINYLPDGGKLGIGGWAYTETFGGGAYLIAEHTVYRDTEDSDRRVTLFAQVGLGNSRANRFSSYTGGGIVVADPLGRRGRDQVGVAVAAAHNGSDYIRSERSEGRRAEDAEIVVELTWRVPITKWLHVQPDLQYVINPDTDPARRNALLAIFRIDLAY